jgi:hypothetical protein
MGRGRMKAVARKVVRDAKYNPARTDFNALEEELVTTNNANHILEQSDTNMSEDELAEYLEWAKNAAEKHQSEKSTTTKSEGDNDK